MSKITLQINRKLFRFTLLFALLSLSFFFSPRGYANVETRENNVVKAVRKVSPAVVNINSQHEIRKNSNPFSKYGMDPRLEKFFNDFFSPELSRREKRTSLGSGVIIDGRRGYVLTNNHVVEKATKISITLNDSREFDATIVGMDQDSDLAVLKIKSDQHLPDVQMGDSDDLMIGESVIAIGNPFGFSHTVTTGVVSAVNRSIKTADRVFHEFIQTDASINPGNSGGPLLNINGELIGINTAIYAQAQGIGFAIPINRAQRIISDLINYGTVVEAWIGIAVQPIESSLSAYLNLENNYGLLISAVDTESPAEQSGLKEGDILISIDGHPLVSVSDFQIQMKSVSVGQAIAAKVSRNQRIINLEIKTESFPNEKAESLAYQHLGIIISEMDSEIQMKYGIPPQPGVLITKMRSGSQLDRIGVKPGDIIRQIGEEEIENMENFRSAIAKYHNHSSLVILIQREGHFYHLNVSLRDN
ncbi:peptidase [Desulfosarcina ovata subsp. sediminis]|uniref:Peptidase n=1 Tax=Desulfosarcina ovata subsp. sediminis TaxID=885957 RepID=A0A5K7ZUU7_9BACT|nr:Do family serine endopeptidase [Desulfosarcina ovata]BBO83999.1 peptidase [Desulfosarcina ovata subsp. sediminis]